MSKQNGRPIVEGGYVSAETSRALKWASHIDVSAVAASCSCGAKTALHSPHEDLSAHMAAVWDFVTAHRDCPPRDPAPGTGRSRRGPVVGRQGPEGQPSLLGGAQ